MLVTSVPISKQSSRILLVHKYLPQSKIRDFTYSFVIEYDRS